jgi:hypothetical protein
MACATDSTADGGLIGRGGLPRQEVLPFPPTLSASRAGRTMQESSYDTRLKPRRLPEDAPNVLIVLIDDAGPGLPDTFGDLLVVGSGSAETDVRQPPAPASIGRPMKRQRGLGGDGRGLCSGHAQSGR